MAVITISRQFASGGSEIAKIVAERLGWTLVDNEFVDRVAERVGLPPEEVAQREERVPSLMERLASTLAVSSPEAFLTTTELDRSMPEANFVRITDAVIHEAAEHGDVVLVGRGAQACLARRHDTVHVRIVAPRDDRVADAASRLHLSQKEAERKVDAIDHDRKAYVQAHYKRDWEDPSNYHLVFNSARMSHENIADLIAQAVRSA